MKNEEMVMQGLKSMIKYQLKYLDFLKKGLSYASDVSDTNKILDRYIDRETHTVEYVLHAGDLYSINILYAYDYDLVMYLSLSEYRIYGRYNNVSYSMPVSPQLCVKLYNRISERWYDRYQKDK